VQKIPKIVHYIWLGGEIPSIVAEVMENNRKYLTDYQVILWTEENIPSLNSFAKKAYKEKKWAFVSDYLRYKILEEYGGVYLDTDMKLLKPLDNLLFNQCFAGWNREKTYIYAGIIGAIPGCEYIKLVSKRYNSVRIGQYPTSPEIMTEVYSNYENSELVTVLNSSFFYPVYEGERENKKNMLDAYSTHLWHESWVKYVRIRRALRRLGIISFYHKFKNR